MRVVTRHQYGISALVSQTSFDGETSGSVAKCRLLLGVTVVQRQLEDDGKFFFLGGEVLKKYIKTAQRFLCNNSILNKYLAV